MTKYAVKIIGGTGDIGAICYKGFDFTGTWFDNKEDAEEFKNMLEYVNKDSSYEIIEEGENMSNLEYAVQVVTSDDGCDGKICVDRNDTNKEFWTDSIIEAQEYKMEQESIHGKWASYKIISREKKNVTESVEQTSKHRHPHADMIIEWAKDTSKVVEYWDDGLECWINCKNYPLWGLKEKYRFQPPKPERVFPTTTLTEDELSNIYWAEDTTTCNEAFVCIANAAIKQYILDTEKADDK